jgi:hypothetical protein
MKVAVRLQPTELWRISAASRERRLKRSSRARAATSIACRGTGECGCDVIVAVFFNPVIGGRIKRRSATHANFDAGIRGLKPHGYRQETAPRSFKTSKLQTPRFSEVFKRYGIVFNGFSRRSDTAKAVQLLFLRKTTSLLWGVNDLT